MCIFSARVADVSQTRIFARMDHHAQVLVYSMRVTAEIDNAMILPVPVHLDVRPTALKFVSLQRYPRFFDDMHDAFPQTKALRGGGRLLVDMPVPTLTVHDVGAFEASYVPDLASFALLDARFRLPDTLWTMLPQYADYGFAVFKLKPAQQASVHPMAFRFLTRHRDRLFFPTLHIHDGTIPKKADFDHTLYFQGSGQMEKMEVSERAAGEFMRLRGNPGRWLADPLLPCKRVRWKATLSNQDTLVKLGVSSDGKKPWLERTLARWLGR